MAKFESPSGKVYEVGPYAIHRFENRPGWKNLDAQPKTKKVKPEEKPAEDTAPAETETSESPT